jgi:hypothetical protein
VVPPEPEPDPLLPFLQEIVMQNIRTIIKEITFFILIARYPDIIVSSDFISEGGFAEYRNRI